jgi:hypothetical protein
MINGTISASAQSPLCGFNVSDMASGIRHSHPIFFVALINNDAVPGYI